MFRTVLYALILCTGISQLHAAEKPNIILILIDDIGYADMSFHPDAPNDVHTPAIDRIADQSVYFSQGYSTAPICSPARVGLATGRYQQRWGNYWYSEGGLPRGISTIASSLRELGYATKKIGKNHNNGGPADHPLDHGFDEFLGFNHHTHDYLRLSEKDLKAYQKLSKSLGILEVGPLERNRGEVASYENGYATDIFTDEAIEFFERKRPAEQPFFVHLSYNAMHMPTYVGHPDYLERFGVTQAKWDRNADSWAFPFWDPRKETWAKWHQKWGHLGKVDPQGRQRYLLQLAVLDDNIARLLDALESNSQLDNTVLVFLSDNGGTINTYSNNGRLAGSKYMFGEGGVRVPILLSYPARLASGTVENSLVSSMDLYPTLLELAGGKAPADIDGRSLIPLLEGRATFADRALHWAKDAETWAMRSGSWKLSNNIQWDHTSYRLDEHGVAHKAPDIHFPGGPLRLVNLDDDIGETTDLSASHPEIVQRLLKLHQTWQSQMGPKLKGKQLWQTYPPLP
ncbi:sulfatase-like hydrolase/transferase [Pelagicoccus sp. SDUM812005]|uniref:sulfatase family protein n=1 Tax=Pelagicoccus sp. SDUM812005 TaxID=3041257 RepID=UPI00280E3EF5|nr:sulfatase-like hydrolase/transferase [Pelagicoccus sp. SDUM812005]MDQ8183780.1 sulfatase-like hydrolase/transferase [Pelagicoccus sp. SDUM812005]